MNLLTLIFGYFFSISFFLFGILILFISPLSGVLILSGSALIFPKFTNQIKNFIWTKIGKNLPKFSLGITCFVLIFSSILVFSSPNTGQNGQAKGVNYTGKAYSSNSSNTINSYNSSANSSANNVLNSSQKSTEIRQESSQKSVSVSISNVNNVLESENNSSLAKSQEIPKNTVANTDEAIKTDISKLETTQINKKLYQVLDVVDGDTIKISEIGTLRLIGIDTPETKDPRKVVQCFGKEASENAKKLLSGQKVYLEYDKSKAILDKYKRTLAYVFREDGYFYNLEAVKSGFAHSYKQYPHPKLDEFNLAENSARNDKKGFWADNTCSGNTEQGVGGEVAKAPVSPTGGTQEKAVEIPKAEIQIEKTTGGFVAGSCAALKKLGLGNFRVGDPNYNRDRDRNGDGVACEM
jgi:micrococcal nuclease